MPVFRPCYNLEFAHVLSLSLARTHIHTHTRIFLELLSHFFLEYHLLILRYFVLSDENWGATVYLFCGFSDISVTAFNHTGVLAYQDSLDEYLDFSA